MSTQQKFHLSSDEEDPEFLESNKELEKLNSMWRNLKEVRSFILIFNLKLMLLDKKKFESSKCFIYFKQNLS